MTFGEVVRLYLRDRGMTQSELARRMGVGRQTVNSLLKEDGRSPILETAIAVANALDVQLQELVDTMKSR
ncbi:MAG: helix-turn-helix transcriptional regulator [Atopobiaceae bacterium]|nr:helix-turn-helix transcriptional regulator [Atopobiaceae bacterium]MBR3161092.1 helix-turn-helix transcriptional regulator [Atopobiaceae bacterium]